MPSWSVASCTVPMLAIDEFGRGLAGDVQHRRAGEARLDQAADGVRRTGSGGREDHAQAAGDAGIAVGHVRAAEFAARHHEADGVAPADRVQHRDVVHRGDAERGGDAALRQELGDQIADGVVARHRKLLFVAAKLEQVVWSVNQCAVWSSGCGCSTLARLPWWKPREMEGMAMASSQADKANRFRALHAAPGAFVIANAWDAGSARILAGVGFVALATSSGAAAGMLGRRDGLITRDESLAHARAVVEATDLPVSADLEKGFGDTPDAAAATIRLRGWYRAGRRFDRGRDRQSAEAAVRCGTGDASASSPRWRRRVAWRSRSC